MTAYSSLGTTVSPGQENPLLGCDSAREAASACGEGVSPAQVLLRWAVERGHSVLPKSTSGEHIKQVWDKCLFVFLDRFQFSRYST